MYIQVSEADFEGLWRSAGEWKKNRKALLPQLEEGRFQALPGESVTLNKWKMAYWFESLTDRIIAKNFLIAQGHKFQEITDEREFGTWVLLTDYRAFRKGESWL